MNTAELASIVTGIIVLAGISIAILRGDQTAKVMGAGASGFARVLQAATAQNVTT